MEYLLFTYPHCSQCEALKAYLDEKEIECQEFSLPLKQSKMVIREFLDVLKRDDKGAIIIPTLVVRQGREVLTVLNSKQELDQWLKSKA
ncbi:MAG: glutaredoxin domain-containing protein [Candidatus Aminicenantes bacterium]